jgi:hypothetical protein
MVLRDWNVGSHQGSEVADLEQSSLSPSAGWRLKMLQLVIVKSIIVTLIQ